MINLYKKAIEFNKRYFNEFGIKELQISQKQLNTVYSQHQSSENLIYSSSMAAYATARMPATYHALYQTYQYLPSDFQPQTILDLGAGPGTASFAALDQWSSINQLTLVEKHKGMISYQRSLWEHLGKPTPYELIEHDLNNLDSLSIGYFDLVVLGYVLGELTPFQREKVIQAAWEKTKQYCVIVTPGTPYDFQYLLEMRESLLLKNGHLIAPCPHEQQCPLRTTSDWCHFSVRLERSLNHKRAKHGTLGYEDEKFSYLIFSKNIHCSEKTSRVLRKPLKRPGHIILDLCTETGLQRKTIGKKDPAYKKAMKTEWGDNWND